MPAYYFAAAYGSGDYGSSAYSSTSTGSGTTTTATGSTADVNAAGSATLANTGFDLLLAATLGTVIIFSALVIRFWKKPAKKQSSSSVD